MLAMKWTPLLILISSSVCALAAFPSHHSPTACIRLKGDLPWVGLQVDEASKDVRCLSLDALTCLWSINVETCWGMSTPTFLACGDQYSSIYGQTGFEDPESWCSRGRRLGTKEKPTKISYGTRMIINAMPESGNNPDGTLSSVFFGNHWNLYWPNGKNWRSESSSPFYQDSASGFNMIYGWVPCQNPSKWGTFYSSGFWIFHVSKAVAQKDTGRMIGLGHAETGTYGNGVCKGAGTGGNGATFKVLAVSYSNDGGASWMDPEIIISTKEFDRFVPTETFSGAGDPGFSSTETEHRAHFQLDGRLCFARSWDSEARPGTWQVMMEDGSFKDAINFGGACKSLIEAWRVGPNPHLTWDARFSTWIMTLWPWGSMDLHFYWSDDGVRWTHIQTSWSFRQDTWFAHKPIYPTVISRSGSHIFDGDGFLYYAHWVSDSQRQMWAQSVSIN